MLGIFHEDCGINRAVECRAWCCRLDVNGWCRALHQLEGYSGLVRNFGHEVEKTFQVAS